MTSLLLLTLLAALYDNVPDNVRINVKSEDNSFVVNIKSLVIKFDKISKQEIVQKWSTEYKANIATYLCLYLEMKFNNIKFQ